MAEIARDVDLSKLEGQPTQRAEPQLQHQSTEVASDVDLSKLEGQPTARADVQFQLENTSMEANLPGGVSVKTSGTTFADSPQAVARTTLALTIAGCAGAAIPLAAGAPAWVPITILVGLPPAIFMLIRFTYRKWSPR